MTDFKGYNSKSTIVLNENHFPNQDKFWELVSDMLGDAYYFGRFPNELNSVVVFYLNGSITFFINDEEITRTFKFSEERYYRIIKRVLAFNEDCISKNPIV